MASTGARTRTTRVPHTDKRPERCPHCGSTHVTRKGTRKRKIEIVQLWRCASCKRVFMLSPAALRNKTYPLHVVLDAITLSRPHGYAPRTRLRRNRVSAPLVGNRSDLGKIKVKRDS